MVSMNNPDSGENLSDLLKRVVGDRERIVLSRDGKPAAALIPIEDLEWLEEIEDKIDNEMADRALAEGGETVAWEVIKKRHGL
jgi:prevent-host-death family protein